MVGKAVTGVGEFGPGGSAPRVNVDCKVVEAVVRDGVEADMVCAGSSNPGVGCGRQPVNHPMRVTNITPIKNILRMHVSLYREMLKAEQAANLLFIYLVFKSLLTQHD